MNRLQYLTKVLVVATGATALALPPAAGAIAMVPAEWGSIADGTIPQFELELTGSTTIAVTDAVMYGARLRPLTYADQTVTGSAAANTLTKASHGLITGDGPFTFSNAGGALPGGLADGTQYWVVYNDANSVKVATSLANALAGTTVDLTSDGTGTTTISDVANDDNGVGGTQRLAWQTHDGLLGLGGDGAIALTVATGYSKRIPHSPRVVAYCLVATLDTGNVDVRLYPLQSR